MKRVFGASHMSDLQLQHFNIGICHNSGLASWHVCGNVVLPGSFVVQLQSEYLGTLSSAPRGNLMEMHSYAGSTWAGHCADTQLIAHIWTLCWKCQKHCFRLFEWNLHTFALRQWPHYQFKLLQIQLPPPKKKFNIVFTLPICLIFFSPNDFCSSRFSHFVFASCGISGPLNENFDSALPFHFPPWRILPSNPRSPPLGQDQIIYQCTAKRLCLQCTMYNTLGSNVQSSVQSDSHPYKSNALQFNLTAFLQTFRLLKQCGQCCKVGARLQLPVGLLLTLHKRGGNPKWQLDKRIVAVDSSCRSAQ